MLIPFSTNEGGDLNSLNLISLIFSFHWKYLYVDDNKLIPNDGFSQLEMSLHKVTLNCLIPNTDSIESNYRLKNNTKCKAYIWQSYVTVLILPPCLHPKLHRHLVLMVLVCPHHFLVSCTNHCVWVYVTCPVLWIPSPCHVTIFCKSSTYPPTLIVFLEVGALKWVLEIWGDISLHKYCKSLLTQMKIVLIKQSLHNLTFVHLT